MKPTNKKERIKFIAKSGMWAAFLYLCVIAVMGVAEHPNANKGDNEVIVSTSKVEYNKPEAANISIDSFRKSISYADKVITIISTQLLPVLHSAQ